MNLVQTTITDNTGKTSSAHVAKCNVCDSDTFHIFVVNGHNHIQCANPVCAETYCQAGVIRKKKPVPIVAAASFKMANVENVVCKQIIT